MRTVFSRDYISEQPFHPERNFDGKGGVRNNWSFFFIAVPDIQVDILSDTVNGDMVWSELHMQRDNHPRSVDDQGNRQLIDAAKGYDP